MDEQANNAADGSAPDTAPKRNRGWFQRGDARINLEGRPRGSKAAAQEGPAADLASCADRVMVLYVPGLDLLFRLGHQNAPWIVNLPADGEIVSCRVDAARGAVALVIRSESYPRIAQGAVIPEFRPDFNGLRWKRR
jgi:hypothetical protein